jgi:hypothetical protein
LEIAMHAPLSRILAASLVLAGAAGMTRATATSDVSACAAPGAAHPETPSGAACRLADELDKAFVFPEQGRAYAAMLRRNAAAGRYAAVVGDEAAKLMTADVQAVAPDGHLRVSKIAEETQVDLAKSADGAPAKPKYPPLIEQPGWIAPGIAFIRINAFMPDEAETAEVAKFMADHAEAKAIVFDIRTHRGGGLDQMNVIFPWLFEKETRLVTMAMRRSVEEEHGTPFRDDDPTMRKLEGTPQETVREHWALPNADPRLRNAKVYVLTSERTGSAAEHFALALKRTGRGRLVGSNTAGANHFGGGIPLPGGFEAFMPVGRTYDPVTGKDWEGSGVTPDVAVPPANALAWVLKDLGIGSADAERLALAYAPAGSMERHKL